MKTTAFFDRKIKNHAEQTALHKCSGEALEKIIKEQFNEIHFWTDLKATHLEYDVEFTFDEYRAKYLAEYNAAKTKFNM